jgi:hypothetical protein
MWFLITVSIHVSASVERKAYSFSVNQDFVALFGARGVFTKYNTEK